MDQTLRQASYIYADVLGNNNKFWNIQELSNASCHIRWGRVGSDGQTQTKSFGDQHCASSFFDAKCREKQAKGYQPVKAIIGSGPVGTMTTDPNEKLAHIASKQIETDSPQTLQLVKRLAEANVHNILSSTTLTYDISKGTFSTPLGILTEDAIDDARATLAEMSAYVRRKDFRNSSYITLLNRYLRLVPQKVGRQLDPQMLYPDLQAIRQQNDILDSLEASLKMVIPRSGNERPSPEPKLFQSKLSFVEKGKTIDRIRKVYSSTWQRLHSCNHLDVKTAYQIEIASMKRAFEEEGKKVGNVLELWHGTKVSNLLSILKSGFVIPPSNAPHCTGRMFGNGVYFSDQSTKSLNYAYGYWNGTRDENCFMLLSDVAMGKHYVPRSWGENLPKKGYDSTFAEASKSGVLNNEMIVYQTSQINPKFLVEFSPKGR